MPSVVLAARRAQEDPRDVVAVPSVILVAKRAQVDPGGFVTKSSRIWPQKELKWTKEVLQKCPRRF